MITLPINQTVGFSQKFLNNKNTPINTVAAPNNAPITVRASNNEGLYSIFLPVCLLVYSRNLWTVTCPSVCVICHLNFDKYYYRSYCDNIAVLGKLANILGTDLKSSSANTGFQSSLKVTIPKNVDLNFLFPSELGKYAPPSL